MAMLEYEFQERDGRHWSGTDNGDLGKER